MFFSRSIAVFLQIDFPFLENRKPRDPFSLDRAMFIILIFQKFVTIRIRKNYKLQKFDFQRFVK
ncbi:hypothetical protein [Leptospira sanjuanensis]|uniref:hypothetical protein n=1 Tax=Leptospira sanjuanensis TaxID=2879643 RepID=UPI0029E80EB8|nr:hypothetical protein [Leptospira sanjuanensis]